MKGTYPHIYKSKEEQDAMNSTAAVQTALGISNGDRSSMVPKEIAKAIVAVKKQVKQLGTDETNPHGRYQYVSVDKFYERIGPLMAEAGLALLIDETESDVKEGKTGNPWLFAQYGLRFVHETGVVSEPLRRSIAMPINGPQTYGAAQSYIEKQFLRQVFKIPTGEKDADETPQTETAPRQRPIRPHVAKAWAEPPHDPETGEIQGHAGSTGVGLTFAQPPKPHTITVPLHPKGGHNWVEWGRQIIAAVQTAATVEDTQAWVSENKTALMHCAEAAPRAFKSIEGAFAKMRAKLTPAEQEFIQPEDALTPTE